MPYRVQISADARRRLARIDRQTAERIRDAIDGLALDPRPPGAIVLRAIVPRAYRLRVGDYRVVFRVDDSDETVDVRDIGHRRDIYRRLSR